MFTVTCKQCKKQVPYPRKSVRIKKNDETTYFMCVECLDEKCGIKRVKITAPKMETY